MDKKWYEEAVYLTQNVIEQFYRKNFSSVFPYFHRDIVWIGAADGQFYEGRETVCRQLSALKDLPECVLMNQTYKAVCPDDTFCTVAGTYTGYTIEKSKEIFSAVQRLTFVWKREEASAKIMHMHVSNPLTLKPQDLHFPHTMGKTTYDYMQRIIESHLKQAVILRFPGKDAEIYFFKPDEILYVEASNNHSLVHAINGCHTVCRPLNSIAPALPGQFHRVHRSFIVNRNHVAQVRRYKILISDGSSLPIPEKKYSCVKLALTSS